LPVNGFSHYREIVRPKEADRLEIAASASDKLVAFKEAVA
jgi:hypothetical protein